jgi:hypothetical protein
MSILQLVENFHNIDFSYLKLKPDISYLNNFKGKKILMIGYESWETNLPSYPFKDINKIDKNIFKSYDIIVIGYKINYKKRTYIKSLLNLLVSLKKNIIFEGYSSITNLNLENTKGMFRPIDITKYPFNIKNTKTIQTYLEYNTIIPYLLVLAISTYFSIKRKHKAFRILLFLMLLFVLILPIKKILYINND